MERSLDNYKLNLLHTKATFIRQIKNRSIAARVIDEGAADEESGVNFAEYVAILSGNTDLLEKAKLEQRIAAMKSEQASFYQQQTLSRSKFDGFKKEIKTNTERLDILKKDLKYLDKVAPADKDGNRPNALHLIGVNDTDVKTQADALARIDKTARTNGEYQKIGEIYGFDVAVSTISWTNVQHETCYANQFYVDNGKGIYYSFNNGYLANDPKLATSNFIKALTKIPTLIANSEKKKIELERDIPILQEVTKSKWGKEETLSALQNELSVLDRKIQAEIDKINTTKVTENDDAEDQDMQKENLLQLTTPDCRPKQVNITTHLRTTAPEVQIKRRQ